MFPNPDFREKSLAFCRWSAIVAAIAAPMSTAVTSAASVVMLLAWLASGEALCTLKISAGQATGKMLLLFFAWLLLGVLYTDTAWSNRLLTVLSWKKLAFTFVLLGLFCQVHWKRLFINSYLIVMAVAALISVPLWLAGVEVRPGPQYVGIVMTNYVSQSMAFIAASVCCVFLLKQQLTANKKWLLIAAIALFTFNIFFVSGARSGYLAFPSAIVFAACCLYGFKKLPYLLVAASIIVAVFILSSTTLQQRIAKGLAEKASYQTGENLTSIGLRIVLAENSLALIKERPLFGYGTSSFKTTYSAYVAAKYSDWRAEPISDPHNQYLFVWLENGLIGLVLFFAYIATAIRQGIKNQPYGAIGASFLVAVCVSSLFNSHFKTFSEGNLLAFFVGILLSQQSVGTGKTKPSPNAG